MLLETATSNTVTFRNLGDNIVEVIFFDNQVIAEDDIIQDNMLLDQFTDYKPHKRLIISGHFTEITHTGRETIFSENLKRKEIIIAEAIVIHSIAQKIFSYLYYKINQHSYPIRIFDNVQEAMGWLKSIN